MELGRRDSTTASLDTANSDIPSPSLDLNDLITNFANKGFTAKEMVALSGNKLFLIKMILCKIKLNL